MREPLRYLKNRRDQLLALFEEIDVSQLEGLHQLDLVIRHFVYWSFVENGRPPSVLETANAFAMATTQIQAAYQRLHQHHFFFLRPGTDEILIANPLSATPTLFHVHTEKQTYWANCAWDMLGIPAMLNEDVSIEAVYSDNQAKVDLTVSGGRLQHPGGVVHFAVPFEHWYDDLVYT